MASNVTFTNALQQQENTSNTQQTLTEDFDQFLSLLTTQLQNQDPLSPMDSTEFTNQIVAFSGVEQQINMNQKLDSLVSLQLGNSFSAAQNYVGLDASYLSSEFAFEGAPVDITYALDEEAVSSQLHVRNEFGESVYSEDASRFTGQNKFTWNGALQNGGTAPPGTYNITVDALDVNDNAIGSTTVVTGRVKGVETQNGAIFALIGDRAVSISNILNTQSPAAVTSNGDGLTAALSYVDSNITYRNSEVNFDGTNAETITYDLDDVPDRAKMLIYDSDNNVIAAPNLPLEDGVNSFTWDGILNNGQTAAAGNYRFKVDALDASDRSIFSSSSAQGNVTGVESIGGQIFLTTNIRTVALSDVTKVQPPSQQT